MGEGGPRRRRERACRRPNGKLEEDQELEHHRAPGVQSGEGRREAEPAFWPFSIFELRLLQGNFGSPGLADSGGRLGTTVNVNGSCCQTDWNILLILDGIVIGSPWLSHCSIPITKDYQKLVFPCVLLLLPPAQKWLSRSFWMQTLKGVFASLQWCDNMPGLCWMLVDTQLIQNTRHWRKKSDRIFALVKYLLLWQIIYKYYYKNSPHPTCHSNFCSSSH